MVSSDWGLGANTCHDQDGTLNQDRGGLQTSGDQEGGIASQDGGSFQT